MSHRLTIVLMLLLGVGCHGSHRSEDAGPGAQAKDDSVNEMAELESLKWLGSGLHRTLTKAERAYFGRPMVRVVEAISRASEERGLGPCRLSWPHKSLDVPESLVEEKGIATTLGLVPGHFWDTGVACSDGSFYVQLSPAPRSAITGRNNGIHTVLAQGEGFTLFESTVSGWSQWLFIGEDPSVGGSPPTASSSAPVLARPRSVEIVDDKMLSHPKLSLTQRFDVRALLAVLASVEPSESVPVVTEPAADLGTPAERARAELSVYASLLRSRPESKFAIADHTRKLGWPQRAVDDLSRMAPQVRRSAVASFVERTQMSEPFPAGLKIPGHKLVMLSPADIGRPAADRDHAKVVTFSRVGLSRDLTQAIVYEGGLPNSLVEDGRTVFLQRRGETWEEMYEIPPAAIY